MSVARLGRVKRTAAKALARDVRRSSRHWYAMEPLAKAFARAAANSPYLKGLIRRRAATLARIETEGLDAALARAMVLDDALPVEVRLRTAKADVALITALADLSGTWPLERVTAALSDFADLALDTAIAAALAERDAPNAGFVAIALGKLGSHELNYSSDIDLILLYDAVPTRPREEPAEAAVRIARRVVAIMQERTADGYVFRVDLRLRPSSEITPIAMPVAAAEQYYQSEAETWERTAFIRARACAGDIALGTRFLAAIRPFVWRRSLDYTAIRDIKAVSLRIRDHFESGQAVGPKFDLKRGRGGIREIEFSTQIHQLVWGGRDAALQAPATLDALAGLAAAGRIDGGEAAALGEAYRFLRTIEHRLQMRGDEQTHSVPATAPHRLAVARLSGFADWRDLERRLRTITAGVAKRYDRLIADAGDATPRVPADPADWCKRRKIAPAFVPLIAKWRSGRYRALRSDEAKRAFEALLPDLLGALAGAADPAHAAARLDTFLADLPAGVQFFALLAANPKLLPLLGNLLGIAPVLADALARRPALFDALLARDSFSALPGRTALTAELTSAIGSGTFEQRLDRTRLWTADRRFQLGAQLIEGRDPLGVGADLSDVADAAVATLADAVAADFAAVHGMVPGCRLVVLGLGRYGGRALTHASDLDLVYLFTGDHAAESTGPKPLSATVWFQRVSARLTAALSVPTAAGALYEVDTRLRPSGAKGLLAVTVASFARYQADEAETWEHMALCRARVVASDPADRVAIEAVVATILDRPRDPVMLRRDVLAMRRDIAAAKPGGGVWDVKLASGGLVDLEFIVHFLQLRDRVAMTPDLRAALVALAAAGTVPDGMIAAHDTLTRILALLRLVVAGPLPKRFPNAVEALLASATGATDFAGAETATGLAKAAVRAAWSEIFALGD
jgi:glutamate-ammonia-ligase adenylyltransferase